MSVRASSSSSTSTDTLEGDRYDLMHKLAEELLSNPVIENYSMRVVEDGQ